MRPRSWAQLLPIAEYAHNSWKHNTLKVTPHELITGILQLTIGQRVWLEGCNLHIRGLAKLLPKWYGPFQIKQKIGNVAYCLELPESIKVHNIFHIDLLMPYKETEEYRQAYTRPPPITVQSEEEYEVESILQARWKGPNNSLEYKVHWKGYPSANDSWVTHDNLHSPELLKEFYNQGGKVLQDKRRCTRLRKIISSLSCPLQTTNTPSSLRSSTTRRYLPMTPCSKSKGALYTPPISHVPSPTSKTLWWPL